MTITGKKFSELTSPQQGATRQAWCWKLENLFMNVNNYGISPITESGSIQVGLNINTIYLITANSIIITLTPTTCVVGDKFYIVNWGTDMSGIIGSEGITILPYAITSCDKYFAVFQIEYTDTNEFTVTVIENGVLSDGD